MDNIIIRYMSKKQYMKPQMEVLDDTISTILAVSGNGTTTNSPWNATRQQDNTFAEDDDYDE